MIHCSLQGDTALLILKIRETIQSILDCLMEKFSGKVPNNEEIIWCWRSENRIFPLLRSHRQGKIYDVIHFSFFIGMLAAIPLMWWQKKIWFVFLLILLFIYLFCSGVKWEDFYKIITREKVPYSGQTSCLHIALSSCQPVRNLNSDLLPDGTVNCHKLSGWLQLKPFKAFALLTDWKSWVFCNCFATQQSRGIFLVKQPNTKHAVFVWPILQCKATRFFNSLPNKAVVISRWIKGTRPNGTKVSWMKWD